MEQRLANIITTPGNGGGAVLMAVGLPLIAQPLWLKTGLGCTPLAGFLALLCPTTGRLPADGHLRQGTCDWSWPATAGPSMNSPP